MGLGNEILRVEENTLYSSDKEVRNFYYTSTLL